MKPFAGSGAGGSSPKSPSASPAVGVAHPLGYRLLIFDADGTLRRCTVPGQPCPNAAGEWELLPRVKATLARYDWRTTRSAIVSNQGGIGLGYLSDSVAMGLLLELARAAFGRGVEIPVLLCPHPPGNDCICRKPSPYLLYKAMELKNVGSTRSVLFVGDQDSDLQAAVRAGVDFMHARAFFGW